MNPMELMKMTSENRSVTLRKWVKHLDFSLYDIFSYYSTWAMILYTIPINHRIFQLTVKNMLLQCSMGGFYFSYIFPKKINIFYLDLYLDGILLKVMDFLAHQLIFLSYIITNRQLQPENIVEFMIMNLPIFIYLTNFDYTNKYGLELQHLKDMLPFYFFMTFHL